ncbi:tyrosine--tRNA ligase [Myxococcota bacterium]|nr:tyrosine--tRNA ligase [Myxococcota bacterium]MBU1509892.1 tyrosine--tRNA ligase [Myxococcota bacterium]
MHILDELHQRSLFHSSTDEAALRAHLDGHAPVNFYVGFDPTSDSLHVGSLLPMITMARLQRAGHRPIILVGGATGMIGDPSGKSAERQLLDEGVLGRNVSGIRDQLRAMLDLEDPRVGALVRNNADWLSGLSLVSFLRDVGKHFSVNAMIARESVKMRLENREQGISYTEFSYQLLQAYDFLHLFQNDGCTLQLGGSDQWGNITAGADLIRRLTGSTVHGLTVPLLTTSAGTKFGKTEAGTVWLDPSRTSPYHFYQFWLRTADDDVIKLLNYFTFVPLEEIAELAATHGEKPELRAAHTRLAEEMTRLVHGQEGLESALRGTRVFFGGDLREVRAEELAGIFADVPAFTLESSVLGSALPLVDLCALSGFVKSKGEARRLLESGGVSLNQEKVTDKDRTVSEGDFLFEKFLVLRSGKRNYHLIVLKRN